MNKIYKVVWSKVKNCYVVVSEVAKNIITGGVKSAKIGSAPMAKGLALGAAMAFVITGNAWANEVVTGNHEVPSGSSYENNNGDDPARGGAIHHSNGTLTIDGTIFNANKGTDRGAAIYTSTSDVTITNSKFINHDAKDTLSVIYLKDGSMVLDGNVFNNGESAVHVADSNLTLSGNNEFLNHTTSPAIMLTDDDKNPDTTPSVTFKENSYTLFSGATTGYDIAGAEYKNADGNRRNLGAVIIEKGATVVAEAGVRNDTLEINGGTLEIGGLGDTAGYYCTLVDKLSGKNGVIAIDSKWFDNEYDHLAFVVRNNESVNTVIKARDVDLKGGAAQVLKNVVDELEKVVDNRGGNDLIFATAAVDSVLRGDVELKDGKVITAMDTDTLIAREDVKAGNVSLKATAEDVAGIERTADSKYYQSTTIEGKTTIDSMGRVYTNHVFADQAIVVGDHSTLDSTGLYVGKNFKVNKETGDVEAAKVNGAEISEYKFNGVTLDKDGDVFAKDITATGYITSLEGITSLKGLKAAGGKFTVDGTTGMVRTEGNIFTKNGVTVFDYTTGTGASVTIQKDGIYGSNANGERTFTVDSKTGDVTAVGDVVAGDASLKETAEDVAGIDRTAAGSYGVTTIEGKTTVDSMGNVRTEGNIFAKNGVTVFDYVNGTGASVAIQKDGIYASDANGNRTFTVDSKTGDVTAKGDVVAGDVSLQETAEDVAGIERTADSKYYQSTTIEGKTTIDSMGRVYTNHVFADQAIVVGDHSTLDSTGLYVGKNFKVNKETGEVEAAKVNGAEISEYKFNGVTLDKDGDVFAKDIMATGYITSLEGITSLKGIKAAGGKFTVDGTTGMVRTEGNIFTKNGVTVFDYTTGTGASVTIQKDGIYGSNANGERTFTVDGATGNVTGGSYNGVNVENLKDQVDANIGRIENVENRVTENEFAISQNKQDIATNAEKIETNNKLIAENRDAIADNAFNIETNKQAIEANKDAIEANKDAIEANKDAIEANKDAIEANKQAIETNKADIAANKQAIADEAAAREAADKALSDAIDNVAGDIADTKAQVEDNKVAIADNKVAIEENKAAIEQNAQDIANETAGRVAADNKLQANIDKESVDRQIADAQERAERAQADQELQANIDKEVADRQAAVKAEAEAREEADKALREEVNRLDNRIDKVDAKIDKVGAMAAAMASLKTMGYDPEAPTEIAVGIGQYRNETGLAIGAFHYPNKNFMLNFSLSTAGDEVMGGIGATWKIGRKR